MHHFTASNKTDYGACSDPTVARFAPNVPSSQLPPHTLFHYLGKYAIEVLNPMYLFRHSAH